MTHTEQLRRALRAYDIAGPETPERIAALVCVVLQCAGFVMLRHGRPDAWAAGIVLVGIAAIVVIGASGHAARRRSCAV